MQQEKSNLTLKKKLILSLVIFSISYVIFLFLWLEIKNNYGRVLLSTASHLTAKVLDIDFDMIKKIAMKYLVHSFILQGGEKSILTLSTLISVFLPIMHPLPWLSWQRSSCSLKIM